MNQLADLAEIAHNPISQPQKIDYVYLILQCTSKFNSSLTAWNAKPRIYHTWIKCQMHFCDAQKIFRKTGVLTVQEALHTEQIVNMVSEGINQALMMKDNQITVQQNKSNLVQRLAEMQEMIQNMQNQTNSNDNQENAPYYHPTANA
eukprot:1347712-Ditylum_brightwellii.AAC.1